MAKLIIFITYLLAKYYFQTFSGAKMWNMQKFLIFKRVPLTIYILYRRRDKLRICVFYASVKSRYAIVLKIKRTRYAEHFSNMQITAIWCVSVFLTFLSILQTEFCVFINLGEICTFYCHKWPAKQSRFCYFEHTVNRFATMLKQKTAGNRKTRQFLVTAWRHHTKHTKRWSKVVWVWILIDSQLVILEKVRCTITGENSTNT